MSRYRAYPEYSETGQLGLENIPSSWTVKRIKHLFSIGRGRVISQEELDENGRYPVYSSQTQNNGCLGFIDTFDFDCRQITWTTDGANAGTVFVRHGKHNCTNVCGTLQPCGEVDDLDYFYFCLLYVTQFYKRPDTNGAKIMNNEMAEIFVPLPSVTEREKIVSFLVMETAKIDTLVEKQQLIKLLKEKRQAVISHAVTKGLNPNVPMKDSGVEWLGEVPAHWAINKVKHFSRLIGGYAFKSEDFVSAGVRAIKITNVHHQSFNWEDVSYLPENYVDNYSDYIAPIGSLVFAMTRPIVSGGIKVAKYDLAERCLMNQRVGFLDPSDSIINDYLLYVSQSISFFCAFENNITATIQPNISPEGIESIKFACPSLDEQKEIVRYLDRFSKIIHKTIERAEAQIYLLQERRTALISAAVTGKIDVRDWQPPTTA